MKTEELAELEEAFDFPIYALTKNPTGYFVDVLSQKEGALNRNRYFVTAGTQCTCLGFMKGGDCRHLKMLRGDYSWSGDGAVAAYAVDEATRLAETVGVKHYPEFVGGWVPAIDAVPDIVIGIELRVGSCGPGGIERFVSVKTFADGQTMAIALIFGDSGSLGAAKTLEKSE